MCRASSNIVKSAVNEDVNDNFYVEGPHYGPTLHRTCLSEGLECRGHDQERTRPMYHALSGPSSRAALSLSVPICLPRHQRFRFACTDVDTGTCRLLRIFSFC